MINVALLGFGTVGSGCAEVLTANAKEIEKYVGEPVKIKYILDLREFPGSPFEKAIVHDFGVILNDPEVSVVAEMMGGSHPAYDFTKELLMKGKSVVTSNKEVVSTFGVELLATAAANGVRYLFEASVGGGIPIIRPLVNDLAANKILAIDGILNGTTNFILTKMRNEGAAFADVLKEAQALGYAERNPAADVEGIDAARKIAILAALASGTLVSPDDIPTTGICGVETVDMDFARALGYAIKLIGHYEPTDDGRVSVSVAPRFVPVSSPLSSIDDVFNGILVRGNMLGDSMFYGRGAGKYPTASAVCSDIIDAAFTPGSRAKKITWSAASAGSVVPANEIRSVRCAIVEAGSAAEKAIKASARAAKDGFVALITEAPVSEEELRKLGAIRSYYVM